MTKAILWFPIGSFDSPLASRGSADIILMWVLAAVVTLAYWRTNLAISKRILAELAAIDNRTMGEAVVDAESLLDEKPAALPLLPPSYLQYFPLLDYGAAENGNRPLALAVCLVIAVGGVKSVDEGDACPFR
ncbi:MAG: hypothetical protein AB7T49_12660 [Oligoflexales bacterium]